MGSGVGPFASRIEDVPGRNAIAPCERSTFIFIPAVLVHDSAHLRQTAAHSLIPTFSHESAHARQMSAQARQIVAEWAEWRSTASAAGTRNG